MYKIAITGKANSGKNTLGKLLSEEFVRRGNLCEPITKYIAFADPVKNIARLMFPNLPRKYLVGPSKFRTKTIPGAFKNGIPLTVRQLLIDIGTEIGRQYNDSVWLDAFDVAFKKAEKAYKVVIVTDVRFRNEFDHLKKQGFFHIKLLRNSDSTSISSHISETNQESIKNEEFDYILDNNGSLDDLKEKVKKIVDLIVI